MHRGRAPQIRFLADGKRLHLQDGPIDLIVEARGSETNVRAAYDAAARRFTGVLDELCDELKDVAPSGRSNALPAARHGRAPSCMSGGGVRLLFTGLSGFQVKPWSSQPRMSML